MNESPSLSKSGTTPAALRKSWRSGNKKSGNKNVSKDESIIHLDDTPETSTNFVTGKVIKVIFFGSEVAEINELNENEQVYKLGTSVAELRPFLHFTKYTSNLVLQCKTAPLHCF